MVPERYAVIDRMPVTGNGKIDTAKLEAVSDVSEEVTGYALPRDLAEFRLAAMSAEVLGLPHVGVQDDFFRLGGHSLLCVRLAGMIYEEFQQRLPLSAFFTCRTVEQLAERLRAGERQSRSCLVPIRPNGSKPPLFCLPGAGGSVVYFYPLVRHLDPDRPIWGIQAQGLDGDGAIPERIEEMASHYIDAIQQEIAPDGPYHFVGHSLGGLVAYEMARQLHERGFETEFLGIIDNAAPRASVHQYEHWDASRWLRHIAIRLEKLYQVRLGALKDGLADDDLIDQMLAAGLLPPGTSKAYFRRFIEVYRCNALAAAQYQPQMHSLAATLTLFRAEENDMELNHPSADLDDEALGWRSYTEYPVEVVTVPGTHITMMGEPHVQELALHIQEHLDRVLADFGSGRASLRSLD
jgi:thioesterase domain-containing protein/acyl carrier protein